MFQTRQASIGDFHALYEINKECLPVYYQPIEYMHMLLSSNYLILVTEDRNSTLVGYCVCEFQNNNNNNRCHILSIGVKNEFRKNGIGNKMMNYLVSLVKNKSKFITLLVQVENIPALNFYKKNNFKIIEEKINYYSNITSFNSKNAYYMIKQLN